MDEVTTVDRIDTDHECEALSDIIRVPGGSGANTAYALARLGTNVKIAGIIGDDDDGKLLLRSLIDIGMDVRLLQTNPGSPTGRTTTLVEEGGQRFIVVFPGVNNTYALQVDIDALVQSAVSSRIVHLSSFVGSEEVKLQEKLVERIGAKSIISLTPGALYARRGLDRLEAILRYVDIVFLYREQLVKLVENSSAKSLVKNSETLGLMEAFFDWKRKRNLDTPQILVVKDPMQGIINQRFLAVGTGKDSIERYFEPKELPRGVRIQTIDSTGTGDAAAAGFILGMLQKAPLESCIDSAFLMASFVSAYVGARTAFEVSETVGEHPQISQPSFMLPDHVRGLPKT